MYIPVSAWFPAFILTVMVEAPIIALSLRHWAPSKPGLAVLIVFANLASHPAVWFIFPQLLLIGTWPYVLVVEAWAVASEALFYGAAFRGVPGRRAIVTSLAANATSFLVGRLLFEIWLDLPR